MSNNKITLKKCNTSIAPAQAIPTLPPGSEPTMKRNQSLTDSSRLSLKVPKANDSYDYHFKIVVIGDSNVGKTKLINSFTGNTDETQPTIGVELHKKDYTIEGNWLKILIWDTAGEERYKSLTKTFYRGVKGALVVYDITSQRSYKNVETWISEIRQHSSDGKIPIVVIGNKSDLEQERQVSRGTFYDVDCSIPVVESSALEGRNVSLAFKKLIYDTYYYWNAVSEKSRAKTATARKSKRLENLSNGIDIKNFKLGDEKGFGLTLRKRKEKCGC